MASDFFAMMSRLKYINRWSLMRNSVQENVSGHSLEVAMLAHALALIGNRRLGKSLNAERAALIGMYHDAAEIITGDMPTPVKYHSKEMEEAFQKIEEEASMRLLQMLPQDLQTEYEKIFEPEEKYAYEKRLVKAADKLSALIKCIEEKKMGNLEFVKAELATKASLCALGVEEVEIFMEEFLPAYLKTLDELQ